MKAGYAKASANVDKIVESLEQHQLTLMKDVANLDQMVELNAKYQKELTMYIIAGKKKLKQVREVELRAAIEKYTEEIDAINRVRRCPACNAVVSDTARFCSSCGAEIPELVVEPVAEAPVSREICPNCGAVRQEGARFCTGCGHDFETKTAEDPEEPAHEDDLQ